MFFQVFSLKFGEVFAQVLASKMNYKAPDRPQSRVGNMETARQQILSLNLDNL